MALQIPQARAKRKQGNLNIKMRILACIKYNIYKSEHKLYAVHYQILPKPIAIA